MTNTRFSDDLIVQYLLGELSEKQQVELEDRAFQDPVLLSNIAAVEHDLIDEYVAGEIRANRLERFESHFLASQERLKKVAFAKALKDVVAQEQRRQPAREQTPHRTFFASLAAFLNRPAAAYAFGVAVLVLAVGAVWLVMNTLTLRSELARLRSTQDAQSTERRRLETELDSERKRSDELAAQLEQAKQNQTGGPTPETPRSPSPIIAALTLLPGLSRSEGTTPKLTIAKDANTVRLQIVIDPRETYRVFSAVVSAGGRTVYSAPRLVPTKANAGRSVYLNIAASAIKSGRHEVSLKGLAENGSTEDVGFYYFDVTKK